MDVSAFKQLISSGGDAIWTDEVFFPTLEASIGIGKNVLPATKVSGSVDASVPFFSEEGDVTVLFPFRGGEGTTLKFVWYTLAYQVGGCAVSSPVGGNLVPTPPL